MRPALESLQLVKTKSFLAKTILILSFAIAVGLQLWWLIIFWPGRIAFDDIFYGPSFMEGHFSGFYSFSYSAYEMIVIRLLGGLESSGLILFLLYSTILVLAYFRTHHLESDWQKLTIAATVLIFAGLPVTQLLAQYQNRDGLFSYLLVGLALMLASPRRSWPNWQIAALAFYLCLLSDLRQEAKIYLVVFPLLAHMCGRMNFRELLQLGTYVVPFFLLFNLILPLRFNYHVFEVSHTATTYCLPLNQILYEREKSEFSEGELSSIDRIFDVDKMQKNFDPNSNTFCEFKYSSTAEDWAHFKSTALGLFRKYPEIVAKNRKYVAAGLLGFAPGWYDFDNLREFPENLKSEKIILGLSAANVSESAVNYREWLRSKFNSAGFLGGLIANGMIPALLLFCFILIRFRKLPGTAAAAAIVLVRLPIVLLLAPAIWVKYLLSLPLLAMVILPFYFTELKSQPLSSNSGVGSN